MQLHTLLLVAFFSLISNYVSFAKEIVLHVNSPNRKLDVVFKIGEIISYSASYNSSAIIHDSPIALELENGLVLGKNPVLKKSKVTTYKNEIKDILIGKRKSILDEFNELVVNFKGNYSVIIRVYNEGFAYRFKTDISSNIIIKSEQATFNFNDDYPITYIPKFKIDNDGEGSYKCEKISAIPDSVFSLTPAIVQCNNRIKVLITEADLRDYPGLNLNKDKNQKGKLIGQFAKEVAKEVPNSWVYKILERKNFLAETWGQRMFPWRTVVVVENDIQLADCDIIYKLATPVDSKYKDLHWIQPGKASWDWWYDWSIEGVDFKGEMESYEFYKWVIDWTASQNLEYTEISVGWTNDQNILEVSKRIRMPELVKYAKSKNVKVLVWVIANTLERQFDEAFVLFKALGVSGIKVDFMDADHQGRIKYYERIAKKCMEEKLLVYYHGACKPTGLERTYPCIINYEGVQANEYNKFFKVQTPKHSVNVAYIRNFAGGMDMNCGPMKNVQGDAFTVSEKNPMSQGTRCHQLAMYVVYYSPLQMVSDAPSTYMKEQQCMDFIASVPTSWDDSKALSGELGEYIVMARRKESNWFLGALTNEKAREIDIELDFLENSRYRAFIYKDGVNAHKVGVDYKYYVEEVTNKDKLHLALSNGGGYCVRFEKIIK